MPTQEERILELNPPRHKNVHYTWHKFCDYMKKWFYEMVPNWVFSDGKIVRDGTKSKSFDSEKMVGYKAVCRLRKYSKRKDGIDLVSCDDSYHMRSNIALIQHRESNHFMGVTMISVRKRHQSSVSVPRTPKLSYRKTH